MMDGKDYDEIRNMTLLFFLDRLMDKGQPRTLHDLSCQFGTKGFTKEMRQIAGGSQSGLRKFLSLYPSLFTIDGDKVSLTSYSNGPSNPDDPAGKCSRRDYGEEAMEYFRDKLAVYGAAEVPIKSLLGHRSQATPEVRHISGQHVREFRDFLQKYPEVFVVLDEHVLLRKHLEELQNSGQISSPGALEYETVDPDLMNELLASFMETIQTKGPMSVEHLFGHLSTQMPREKWQKMVKNPQDLSTFLKMHSNTFLVQSNMVTMIVQPVHQYQAPPPLPYMTPSPPPLVTAPPPRSQVPQTFKERVMSHVMKAVAENTAMEQRVTYPYIDSENYPELSQMRILKAVKIITKIKECNLVVRQLLNSNPPVISLDGEGVNLGPSGPMTLLQIGTWDGQVFLFDLISNSDLISEGGLKGLLESTSLTKVVHDCRNDSGALYHQHGVVLRNVWDTQGAHAIIQLQQTGKPVYKVKNISLNTLCKMYGGPVNPKKDQMKKIYRRDQKFWSRRPLSDEMIVYASYDVLALVPTVYESMRSLLLPAFMPLFLELCQEQINTYIKVDEVKQKKKTRKIETEVSDLKAKLAMATGRQVVLSNREIRLLRYLELSDEEREKLEGSYKVARKLERLQAKNSEGGSVRSVGDSETSPENGELNEYEDELEGDMDSLDDSGGKVSPDSPYHRSSHVTSPSGASSWTYVDEYLANGRIETLLGVPEIPNNNDVCCHCACHKIHSSGVISSNSSKLDAPYSETSISSLPVGSSEFSSDADSRKMTMESGCQTLSTGDIVITRVFFDDREKDNTPPLLKERPSRDALKK